MMLEIRAAFLLVWAGTAGVAPAAVTVSTPFRGITDTHVAQPAVIGALDYHVLKIDMADPDIRFQTTAGNGVPGETDRQTTRQFVEETHAQVGINANFYGTGASPTSAKLISLAASAGSVITPWDSYFNQGLNLSADNVATIIEADPKDPTGLANTAGITPFNAIAGVLRLVRDSKPATIADPSINPRTAAGVDNAGDLILMVVDGRNSGHSDGMTFQQLADTMAAYGAVDAFSLDGGGSSTLVFADPTARVVNTPVGLPNMFGLERSVGNNLAIFAAPVPEPAGMIAVAAAAGLMRRRRRAGRGAHFQL